MKFKHIYQMQPIDFWDKAELADEIIRDAVLEQMPEVPRDEYVYKLVLPDPPMLREVYLCKADNNGTTYLFSDFDISFFIRDAIEF